MDTVISSRSKTDTIGLAGDEIMSAAAGGGVEAARAADLLLGQDPWGASWIAAHRARLAAQQGP